ncbi:succinate-CoA transferase [Shigella flexneri]
METQWTRMTADEAAEIIQHNDMVAFSGFTRRVRRKPTHRDCRRANEQHEAKKLYQIRLLTGVNQRRR